MEDAEDGPLPSPASGLFLEVSFRRLLASCEDIVAGTSIARPDLIGTWRRSPVFHHYVETLQEQLADLEASGGRVPRALLARYAEHVDALSAQLQRPDVPAFCAGVGTQLGAMPPVYGQQQPAVQQQQLGGGMPGTRTPPPAPLPRPAVVPPPLSLARTPQVPQAGFGGGTQSPPPRRAPPPAGQQSSRLQTQQQLHEDLTEELAGLAARLKGNTLAIEGRLKERGALLESTEGALDASLQQTKQSKESATAIHRKGRVNFCLTLLVMLVVGLVFAAMYVFIKVTRFAGYRAAAPAAVPAPVPAPAAFEPPLGGGPGGGLLDAGDMPVYEDHGLEL